MFLYYLNGWLEHLVAEQEGNLITLNLLRKNIPLFIPSALAGKSFSESSSATKAIIIMMVMMMTMMMRITHVSTDPGQAGPGSVLHTSHVLTHQCRRGFIIPIG